MERPGPKASFGRQVSLLIEGIRELRVTREDARFEKIVGWVKDLPMHARPPELFTAVSRAFSITEEELYGLIDPKQKRPDFEPLVPKRGWLADYVRYTRKTEPPTVFHFFVGATILGATMRRNVFFERGNGNIYPNICAILVAPSGVCRKTSCCEMGMKLFRTTEGMILADKITPEALVNAYKDRESATGLIYSGELKQFLGSQRYMEGMIPLLTRLLDCPDIWTSATIGKGEISLKNVAFSMLGASTMDWLRMLPSDSFGGGFMSRFMLIVQETTPKRFAIPPPLDQKLKADLIRRLQMLTPVQAKMKFTPNAEEFYIHWYNTRELLGEEKLFSGYFERKPDNLIRLAMVLSVSEDEGGAFIIEVKHLKAALAILDWVESWLPAAFGQLGSNAVGEEHQRLISQLKKAGGALQHSVWLRKNTGRMQAPAFKSYVQTLREAKLVDFDPATHSYYLTPEGWKQ